jgi:predicted Zn-dependent protease
VSRATLPPKDAVASLVAYLKLNQADAVAWRELAGMYEELGDWEGAAFA